MTTQDIDAAERQLFDHVAEVTGERLHDLPDSWNLYSWDQLHTHRKAARRTMKALNEAAQDRLFTDDESRFFDDLGTHVEQASDEIDRRQASGRRGPSDMAEATPGTHVDKPGTGPSYRDLVSGSEIRGLKRGEALPVGDYVDPSDELRGVTPGDLIQGLVTGRYPSDAARHLAQSSRSESVAAEARTMSVGTNSLGGFSVPSILSAEWIDLARNSMATMRAGATTVPMTSNTLDIARNAGDSTSSWKTENAALASSDMTLERVQFTARTMGSIIKLSRELWEDAPNISDIVNTSLAQSMALELDRVALVGSGTPPQPQGIWGATNVQTYSANSTATYSMVSEAVELCRIANHEPNAMIGRPQTYGALDRLADTTNQPLMPPPSYAGLDHYSSMQVPLDRAKAPTMRRLLSLVPGRTC